MTSAELANFDGKDGRRAYIAVSGKIYDVTDSPRWENGFHPPDHLAGQDLTDELAAAPHVRAVIERFPVVGTLENVADGGGPGGGKIIIGVIVVAVIIVIAAVLLL